MTASLLGRLARPVVAPLRGFARRSSPDRALCLRALVLLVVGKLVLRTNPRLDRVHRFLAGLDRGVAAVLGPRRASPAQVAWAIEAVRDVLPTAYTCLPAALAATVLATHTGTDVEFRVGAARVDGDFSAHAWVEVDDEVLVGDLPNLDAFQPFPLDRMRAMSGF